MRRPFRLGETLPVLLVKAAHPKQALLTALGLAGAAGIAGRPLREIGLVFATVLVGQTILGWDNDLVDRARDERHELPGKPIGSGLLDPGTAWFSLICALLLVVPLSLSAGSRAGGAYLIAVLVGLIGNRVLRGSVLSFVPWMLQFALYPAYLAYGGWNGTGTDTPPTVAITVLAGLLGLGVHFLRALPGLVPDNKDGLRSLPLRIALKTGAPRLLVLSGVFTGAIVVALLIAGQAIGLT
jgi:4-hydroxybenzoate polyprenyltransferase